MSEEWGAQDWGVRRRTPALVDDEAGEASSEDSEGSSSTGLGSDATPSDPESEAHDSGAQMTPNSDEVIEVSSEEAMEVSLETSSETSSDSSSETSEGSDATPSDLGVRRTTPALAKYAPPKAGLGSDATRSDLGVQTTPVLADDGKFKAGLGSDAPQKEPVPTGILGSDESVPPGPVQGPSIKGSYWGHL